MTCPACGHESLLAPWAANKQTYDVVKMEYRCPQCRHEWAVRWVRDDKGHFVEPNRK
jgi:hypothetical protein